MHFKGELTMKTNQATPFRSSKNNASKMWISLLTTLGLSAAMYGLKKYKNGKYLRPVQDLMSKANMTGVQSIPAMAATTAIAEFSKEIAPGLNSSGNNQQQS